MSTPAHYSAPGAGLQQLAVYGYKLQHSRHVLLTVGDAASGRAFVRALLGTGWLQAAHVTGAKKRVAQPEGAPVDIGITWRGLQALGLSAALAAPLRRQARAFVDGAPLRAAQFVGDAGDDASPCWDTPFALPAAHLLLSVHADTRHALLARWAALQALEGAPTLAGWPLFDEGEHLTDCRQKRVAHFGLRDGIGKPSMRGLHCAADAPADPSGELFGDVHATGELLLGHGTNEGINPWRLGSEPEAAALLHNASFGIYRKIAQHEDRFRYWVAHTAAAQGATPEWVMAKACGRWPDGQLLSPLDQPHQTTTLVPSPRELQADFSADPVGQGCPFGAHVRRMNPRTDALVQHRHRPLRRHGMPYGPRWTADEASPGLPRGLLGLFFCTSIEDQFEHLLGQWADLNPLGPPNRGRAKDPLIGAHADPGALLQVPMAGAPDRWLGGLAPFVRTRGTCYLLYLTHPALRALVTEPAALVA